MLSFSGASRCGAFATRSGEWSLHGLPALSESELVGVPIGGAATVCARMPHIGADACALDTQASDSTNAVRVQSRTSQAFRVCLAEGMSRAGQSSRTPSRHNRCAPSDIPEGSRLACGLRARQGSSECA